MRKRAQVNATITNYELIADYAKRPMLMDMISDEFKNLNGRIATNGIVFGNNVYFAKWLSKLLSLSWIFYGGLGLGVARLGFRPFRPGLGGQR